MQFVFKNKTKNPWTCFLIGVNWISSRKNWAEWNQIFHVVILASPSEKINASNWFLTKRKLNHSHIIYIRSNKIMLLPTRNKEDDHLSFSMRAKIYKNAKQLIIQIMLLITFSSTMHIFACSHRIILLKHSSSNFQSHLSCMATWKQDSLQPQYLVRLDMMPKDSGRSLFPTISNFDSHSAERKTTGRPWRLSQHPMLPIKRNYISATIPFCIGTQNSWKWFQ